jgi:hypothetical protein
MTLEKFGMCASIHNVNPGSVIGGKIMGTVRRVHGKRQELNGLWSIVANRHTLLSTCAGGH